MSFSFGFALPAFRQPIEGSSNILGPSLDLNFVAMDGSYATGETLDLDFFTETYEEWALPTEPQGMYFAWVGYAPWEPSLNLDFVAQIYQEAS